MKKLDFVSVPHWFIESQSELNVFFTHKNMHVLAHHSCFSQYAVDDSGKVWSLDFPFDAATVTADK